MRNYGLLIEAIKSIYGFSVAEAKIYCKGLNNKQKDYLIKGFENACKRAFYED